MNTNIKSLMLIASSLIPSGQGLAADYTNPSFSAVCNESSARTYMAATDEKGEEDKNSWSKEGTASPEGWEFRYKGGNKIEIDGKDAPIVTQHEGVIVALSHGSSGVGSNAWLYAVHLGLSRVVASMVNGYGHADGKLSGILTTSIELTCDFSSN